MNAEKLAEILITRCEKGMVETAADLRDLAIAASFLHSRPAADAVNDAFDTWLERNFPVEKDAEDIRIAAEAVQVLRDSQLL